MSAENLSPGAIWAKTVDIAKDRINSRSLWEALELAYGIAIEDGMFVCGVPSHSYNQSSHITRSDYKNQIEKILASVSGQALSLRVIEGATIADWQATKERDAKIKAARTETYDHRDRVVAASQSWDSLAEQFQR